MEETNRSGSVTGAVMVVGGGIAGIQSALDLANSGFLVYLVEKSTAIGGVMSALDKTFPTNDCSMCILSPKLVEVGRHKNIELMTLSEVTGITGEPGNFNVEVLTKARYVDMDKCIACGMCVAKCPKKVADDYNKGLITRKAIYVSYPQAVPLKYAIDAEHCIKLTKDKCGNCEKECPTGAINYADTDRKTTLNVGALILSPGYESFHPEGIDIYGYKTLPNVVTAPEFERILSASGPFEGHLRRPSDKTEPRKIAWLQCIGSRSSQEYAREYCSGVCCMYAIKEAVIAKEHAGPELDTAIFFMDMRTHGKEFERTYNRAKHESGVRFIRSRVHSIEPEPGSDDLRLMYVTDDGSMTVETFSMVVLSTGMEISVPVKDMASSLTIDTDSDGFVKSSCFSPVETTRPGIFAGGVFNGPKDIPQSVMEASAASASCAALLAAGRDTLTRKPGDIDEVAVDGQKPRIGVFVCHCGSNIGSVVDVPAVRDYAQTLPFVTVAKDSLFSCSQDSQENLKKIIREHQLNRIVIASCSPRTHEVLFQETIAEAGLNPYLLEFTNIRDQNSWVHQHNPEAATRKAKDLVRMAAAKSALLEPLQRLSVDIDPHTLIIGGGIAGMTAALNLADQGFPVYLVERNDDLGGQALIHRQKSWKGDDVPAYAGKLREKIAANDRIEVMCQAKIDTIDGFVGNFETTVSINGQSQQLQHGAVILATGGSASEPEEYLYGQHERVLKWRDLNANVTDDPAVLDSANAVAFIQCVGSREDKRPYCSKICCSASIQSAIDLKERKPELNIFILYRDIRTFGQRELLYRQAREMGIIFIRYSVDAKPTVEARDDTHLTITVKDHVLAQDIQIETDYLCLASAIVPDYQKDLAQMLKVPANADGFYMEAHMKLRPVDFSTDGVFVCGLAHYPKPVEETISQAQAAAGRAAELLTQKTIAIEPIVSNVDTEKCIGCGLCEASCSFGAIRISAVAGVGYRAENFSALCKGCGVCAAACPQKAIDMKHFSDQQIKAAIHAGGVG